MKDIFRKYFPIYINTFNILRPFKTWFHNVIHYYHLSDHKLKFNTCCKKQDFEWLKENFYTWYWWDHPHIWNFEKKWIIIIFEDVQYKWKFGIRQLETCPFVLIRIGNWNLIITLNEKNYHYWESQHTK